MAGFELIAPYEPKGDQGYRQLHRGGKGLGIRSCWGDRVGKDLYHGGVIARVQRPTWLLPITKPYRAVIQRI